MMNLKRKAVQLYLCLTVVSLFACSAQAKEPLSGPNWTDRRPIARVFLARSNWRTPKNPGGHLGPNHDLTTEEGRAEFSRALDAFADQVIATLAAVDGQGIVVWDVEGQEWQGMVYVGDPRVLPEYAPQINNLIDPFFKKILDAGYRTGLCLRPNHIFKIPPDHQKKYNRNPWGYILYREPGLPLNQEFEWVAEMQKKATAKPEEELADRARYANERWGCTLYYVDTNHYTANNNGTPRNRMMTAEQFARLAELAPDSLFMPEHETDEYYAVSAPYNQLNMTGMTRPELRERFPGCFTVNSVHSDRFLAYKWDDIVRGLVGGDALYVDTTGSPEDASVLGVVRAYRAAALRREKVESSAVSLASASPAGRLKAIHALNGRAAAADIPMLLQIVRNDPEWIVRRAALPVLAAAADARADALLLELVRNDQSDLALPAAVALGRHSSNATELLGRLLADQRDSARFARNRAVTGLRICDQPQAITLMIGVFRDKYSANRGWALDSVKARPAKLAEATPAVLDTLEQVRANPHPLFPLQELDRIVARLPKALQQQWQTADRGLFSIWDAWVRKNAAEPVPEELQALGVANLEQWAQQEHALSTKVVADLAPAAGDRIPQLWQAAQDDDPARRYQAVREMDAAGDQRSVEPLAAMLKHEQDPVVTVRMLRAMTTLAPDSALTRQTVEEFQENDNPLVRAFAGELK